MHQKKQIIVIEGPSGVGKDAIIARLMAADSRFEKIVSITDRPMRPNEIDGVTYKFVTTAQFDAMVRGGEIFEHTSRHGTQRGMSRALIDKILNKGNLAIKDADVIGLNALRMAYPNQVISIFITADKHHIESRLIKRGDSPQDRARRLLDFDNCISFAHKYDYMVENNNSLDEAVIKVQNIIHGNI